jgi:carboxyl-terminal processing protease
MHVTQVIRSLSAWQAGVQPGWILNAIDGRTWSQFAGNLRAAHQAIRGPEGTSVSLTFRLPDGGERVIELARKKGSPSSVEGILSHHLNPDGSPRRIAENGIVTAGLSSFYEPKEGTPQWRGAAEDLRLALMAQTASAYLIDLRNTQGGNLEQAIKIADLFLKQGVIVSIRSPDRTEECAATTGDELPELPMAVLVNSWTSSVAEVVAAALQDHRRAAIIGRRTAGRAIMRDFIETPGGGSLLLPVSELLRSTGARLERDPDMTMKDTWGVIPDQIAPPLEPTPSNTSQPEENYQRLWDTTPPDQRDAALKKDVQYQAALEYLKAQLARK